MLSLYVNAPLPTPSACRITWKVLGLPDSQQLYFPGLLPEEQAPTKAGVRPQAPGPSQPLETGSGPGAAGERKHFLLEVREGFQEEVTFKPEGLVGWGWVGRHLSRRVGMGKVGMRQEGWVQGPLAGGGSQSEQPLGTQARALPTLKTFRRAWKPRNGRREVGRIEGYSTDSLPEGGIQNT